LDSDATIELLKQQLDHCCFSVEEVVKDLVEFCRIRPRLPSSSKNWVPSSSIALDESFSREEIIDRLESLRLSNETVDMAFTAYRDMSRCPWKPFVKAALQRNPVCVLGSRDLDIAAIAQKLAAMDNQSIYDGKRMAQPDEVWNYGRGDGLEKAMCLMNIIKNRRPQDEIFLTGDGNKVAVRHNNAEYVFTSDKNLNVPVAADFVF
jgi:hypothetical protein